MTELNELCPICVENLAEIITKCNHTFCIYCLSHIKICAICRSPLQMPKLCIEIKNAYERRHNINNYSHYVYKYDEPILLFCSDSNYNVPPPQITLYRVVYSDIDS